MNAMNAGKVASRYGAIAAALGMTVVCTAVAVAATVRSDSVGNMGLSFGRAGSTTTALEASEPEALGKAGPPVEISYSADLAKWTNMPRGEAQEGPVTDRYEAASAPERDAWYGRAGGLTGSDEVADGKGSRHGG